MAANNARTRMSVRVGTELWFLCLILTYPVLSYAVLRWEQATTGTYIAAVGAQDSKQLDRLYWFHHFAQGTSQVVSRWTTDFGGFPDQAACNSSRPLEMPRADELLYLRLWLLSPSIPFIRHRLEVEIGEENKVTNARYDTHGCYFTPTSAQIGSFTNEGPDFHFSVPIPVLVCLATMSVLLAIACRALVTRIRKLRTATSR